MHSYKSYSYENMKPRERLFSQYQYWNTVVEKKLRLQQYQRG